MIYYKFAQKLQLFFAKLWLDQNMELNFRVANQIQGKIDSRFLQFLSIGLSIGLADICLFHWIIVCDQLPGTHQLYWDILTTL